MDNLGRNKKVIEEYIQNQLQEEIAAEQITMAEYIDSFTVEETRTIERRGNRTPLGIAEK